MYTGAEEMQIKEKLKAICARLNIEYVGIASPGPFVELAEILRCAVKGNGQPRFSEEEIVAKTNPKVTMADVKSIIVCLFPYYTASGTAVYGKSASEKAVTSAEKSGKAVSDTVDYYDSVTDHCAGIVDPCTAVTGPGAAVADPGDTITDPGATVENSDAAIAGTAISKITANISMHAWGRDYHKVVLTILDKIGSQLSGHIDNFKYQPYTDTGPLVDRHLAYLAGLGFYGRNNFIINEKYGSYVFIGYMLNNYPFEPDKPLNAACLECGQCIENCPGSAILKDARGLAVEKCVSYITQKKGILTDDEKSLLRSTGMVYGCDICQVSCPYNKEAAETPIREFSRDQVRSLAMDDLGLTNREFSSKYCDRAFAWRGRKVLERNIRICEGLEG